MFSNALLRKLRPNWNEGSKTLRTDHGHEYLFDVFKGYCEEKCITRHLMIPNTPQQNGVAEYRNRTLLDMIRSMMAQTNLPISL